MAQNGEKHIEFDSSRTFDVVPIGRIAIDFNPIDYFKTLAESENFKKYVGGSPANIAVGLARLGKRVGFYAKVSEDKFGDFVINFFNKEGIDTSRITRVMGGQKLGLTFTEILTPSDSSTLMYRNDAADLKLSPVDIDETYIKDTKAILISGTALSESPSREAALKAMYIAKKVNTRIIFDIDYRNYNWKSFDELAEYYSILAENSDIVIGSREEFDLTEAISAPGRSDKQTAEYWLSRGNKIVIIKRGKQGSTAYTACGKEYNAKPFPIKAIRPNGGGDGYCSAFIAGLLDGKDIPECLEMASASAAILLGVHGGSAFMPTTEELKAFIFKCKSNGSTFVY